MRCCCAEQRCLANVRPARGKFSGIAVPFFRYFEHNRGQLDRNQRKSRICGQPSSRPRFGNRAEMRSRAPSPLRRLLDRSYSHISPVRRQDSQRRTMRWTAGVAAGVLLVLALCWRIGEAQQPPAAVVSAQARRRVLATAACRCRARSAPPLGRASAGACAELL